MRGLVVGVMLAATVLPGMARAQDAATVEEKMYASRHVVLNDLLSGTIEDISGLLSDLADDPGDEATRIALYAETGVLEALHDEAAAIDPPAGLEASNAETVEAYRLFEEAAPMLRDAVQAWDIDALGEALETMEAATAHLETGGQLFGDAVD